MAAIERTAYPRFKRAPTLHNLQVLYTPADAEMAFAQGAVRSRAHQLSLLELLKAFQRLGYFPKLSEVPITIVRHIRSCLHVEQAVEPRDEEPRTLYRHHQAIRTYLHVTTWGQAARRLIIKAVAGAAETMDNPADLINVALETLIKERYELPAFSTLDRLVGRVRTVVNQRYFHTILTRLSQEDATRLDGLLNTEGHGFRSPHQRLKQLPKRPSLPHLQDWITQLEWLLSLGDITPPLVDLPPLKLKHFAAEARALDAAELTDVAPPKRYTLLLYLIHRMRVQCRDQLALMLIKRMQRIQQRGKDELEDLRLRYRERTATLVSLLAEVVTTSEHAASDAQAGSSIRQLLAERGSATQLLEECETVMASSGDHYQPLLWRYYRHDRHALFRLIRQLALRSTSQNQSLTHAVPISWSMKKDAATGFLMSLTCRLRKSAGSASSTGCTRANACCAAATLKCASVRILRRN
jgi:hypothetical protein